MTAQTDDVLQRLDDVLARARRIADELEKYVRELEGGAFHCAPCENANFLAPRMNRANNNASRDLGARAATSQPK